MSDPKKITPSAMMSLYGALIAGLVLRLLYLLLAPQREPLSDDAFYWGTAQALAAGEGYTFNGIPATEYMPGLPLLLSIPVFFFGPSLLPARLLLVLISAATIPLVQRLGTFWFNEKIGKLSAWGFALFPPLWFYSSALLSETPAIFCAALALERASKLSQQFSWRDALLLSLSYVGMLYLKPELAMLGPLYLFVSFFWPRALPRKAAVLMCLVGALSIAPWTYRNWVVFEEFIPLKTTGGKLLYWASLHPPATDERNPQYQLALQKFHVPGKPGATSKKFSQEGLKRIVEDPLPYLTETITVRARMLFIGSQTEASVGLSRSFSDLIESREYLLLSVKLFLLGLQSLVSLFGIVGIYSGKDPEQRRMLVRWHFFANTMVYITLLGITRYSMVLLPMLIPHALGLALQFKSRLFASGPPEAP